MNGQEHPTRWAADTNVQLPRIGRPTDQPVAVSRERDGPLAWAARASRERAGQRIRTHVLSAGERTAAREMWIGLQNEIDELGLMCSWEWTGTWLEHYGDVVPHRFVVGENERGVRGVALVATHSSLRKIHPPKISLGTAGEPHGTSVFVERNRLLARAEDRLAFASALLNELECDKWWHRLTFDGMVLGDAAALLDGRTGVHRRVETSPVTDIGFADPEQVLASLSGGTRRRIRQSLRELGGLEVEWAQTVSVAHGILDELISLHQAHWRSRGRPGAFSSPRFTGFHRDLIASLVPARRAALFRIRHKGTTIACLYGLIEGSRLLFYQSGVRRHQHNRVRVGLVAHLLFMQACCERGLTTYDFLAPAARYKTELASRSEQLVWGELERPGVRLQLEKIARMAKRRAPAAAERPRD